MQQQSQSLINTAYLRNLLAEIQSINTCAELQKLADGAIATLEAQLAALIEQMAVLEPIQALLEIPSDLGAIIGWITNFIDCVLRPMFAAYLTLAAQAVEIPILIEQLTQAIITKADEFEHCTVSLHP